MHSSKICLDTNAYSALLKGSEKVLEKIEYATTIFISVITVGELLAGFKLGTQEEKNQSILQKFLTKQNVSVLPITIETTQVYKDVFFTLRKNGTPIPLNDVWIATHCLEHGAELITYDSHFLNVAGLRVWNDLKK